MAESFFSKSRVTSSDVARHVVRAVEKNKLYVITQLDGKFAWLSKRLTPQLYFDIMGWGYARGIGDRLLGLK
jgi:short-subunit dehydrogenase